MDDRRKIFYHLEIGQEIRVLPLLSYLMNRVGGMPKFSRASPGNRNRKNIIFYAILKCLDSSQSW